MNFENQTKYIMKFASYHVSAVFSFLKKCVISFHLFIYLFCIQIIDIFLLFFILIISLKLFPPCLWTFKEKQKYLSNSRSFSFRRLNEFFNTKLDWFHNKCTLWYNIAGDEFKYIYVSSTYMQKSVFILTNLAVESVVIWMNLNERKKLIKTVLFLNINLILYKF